MGTADMAASIADHKYLQHLDMNVMFYLVVRSKFNSSTQHVLIRQISVITRVHH